jgi:galactitol-specific phosphotransferase system IIB component
MKCGSGSGSGYILEFEIIDFLKKKNIYIDP